MENLQYYEKFEQANKNCETFGSTAQEWKNRTSNGSIPRFLVLPGSDDRQLLRLLGTHVLVYYGVLANYKIKWSKI